MASNRLSTFAPRVINATKGQHSATFIFAHGFGDYASSWESTLSQLSHQHKLHHIKWILPQAPLRRLSLQHDAPGTAWFDILRSSHSERTHDGTEDERGMSESLEDVARLVKGEKDLGVQQERIVVGGFSQGAALALLAGLTGGEKVAGVACLSGYLPLQWKVLQMKNQWANDVPIFVGHGTADPVISFATGQKIATTLTQSGVKQVEFHSYEGMQHASCDQEMEDLGRWLTEIVPPLEGVEGASK